MMPSEVVYQGVTYTEAQMVELWKAMGYQVDYPVWIEFDLGLFAATSSKSVEKTNVKSTLVVPTPAITEKKRRKVTPADLVEVADTSMLLSIDLRRQADKVIYDLEIEEGQRFFPYNPLARLLVGWQTVSHISSMEIKLNSDYILPQVIVRFAEKMSAEDVAKIDPVIKAQIEANIALVRQYPFVRVECPLLQAAK